ncbi:TetR family transcriptional regulator C-terminal domain-containing protein [Nocardioides sp. GXZ039]|uniref:TetR family transcriptional regulator C-terminal domain-containing protein n=1 Tax=Nocardioides sp. GXZ039 TaxID=3136018 RepID=UPI0030F3A755
MRVQVAFTAWAFTDAELAEVRREAQVELRDALAQAFIEVAPDPTAAAAAALAAMSVADGIALHAVSSGPWLSEAAQTAALEIAIDGLVGPPAAGRLPGG